MKGFKFLYYLIKFLFLYRVVFIFLTFKIRFIFIKKLKKELINEIFSIKNLRKKIMNNFVRKFFFLKIDINVFK